MTLFGAARAFATRVITTAVVRAWTGLPLAPWPGTVAATTAAAVTAAVPVASAARAAIFLRRR